MIIECPHCGRRNDIHWETAGGDEEPEAGSWSICWKCKKVSRYEATPLGLRTRALTDDEQRTVDGDPYFQQVLMVARAAPTPAIALSVTEKLNAEDDDDDE